MYSALAVPKYEKCSKMYLALFSLMMVMTAAVQTIEKSIAKNGQKLTVL